MQVKSIAECMLQGEHSAILSTLIKLLFVIKTFVSSICEWPFYTDFTPFQIYIVFEASQKEISYFHCYYVYEPSL